LRGYSPIVPFRLAVHLLVAAVLVLSAMGPPRAFAGTGGTKKLIQALKNPSFKVRLQAAILIGKKKIGAAAEALRDTLDDEHDAVRAAAALSLGKLGDTDSRSRLVSLLVHPNKLVVRSVEKSLSMLDRIKGEPVFLVAIKQPVLPKGVARSRGARLLRVFKSKLEKTGGIILSAGEERVLSGEDLSAHMKKRKVTGIQLQPKVVKLEEKESEGSTTVVGKVSIMVVTLVRQRMEFSGGGEADAWIEDTGISDADRTDLQNTVLDAAADAAIQQVIDYLARRGTY
jgi:hypothetical protein